MLQSVVFAALRVPLIVGLFQMAYYWIHLHNCKGDLLIHYKSSDTCMKRIRCKLKNKKSGAGWDLDVVAPSPDHYCIDSGSKWRHQCDIAALVFRIILLHFLQCGKWMRCPDIIYSLSLCVQQYIPVLWVLLLIIAMHMTHHTTSI